MGIVQLTPGWATQNVKTLSDAAMPLALRGLQSSTQPYGGNLVAAFNPNQKMGTSLLSQYLGSPTPTDTSLYNQAYGELGGVLGGKYDPYTSEYMKNFETFVNQKLQQQLNQLNARKAKSNETVGSSYDNANATLRTGALGSLTQEMGRMLSENIANKLLATQYSQNLLGFGENANVNRINNAYTLGGVEQGQEQAVLDAAYNDWLRQQNAMGNAQNVALQTSMFTPEYMYKSKGQSSLMGGLSGIGSILGGLGGLGGVTSGSGGSSMTGILGLLSMLA